MIGYTTKIPRVPGSFRFQINVYNVLDETEIIPVRVAASETNPGHSRFPAAAGWRTAGMILLPRASGGSLTTWSF